jgi:hypothetical protein
MNDAPSLEIESEAVGLDLRERHRRLGLRGLVASGAVLLGTGLLVFTLDWQAPCLVGLFMPVTGLISLLVLAIAEIRGLPWLAPGALRIEGDTLTLRRRDGGAAWRMALTDLVQGWREEPDRVHLARRNGTALVVTVRQADARERLLHALGVGAAERTLRVPVLSAASQFVGGTTLALLVLTAMLGALLLMIVTLAATVTAVVQHKPGGHGDAIVGAVMMTAVFGLASYALAGIVHRRELIVGADGLVFRGAFGRRRVAYAEVQRVSLAPRGVRVSLHRGKPLDLPTSPALRAALPLGEIDLQPPRNEADTQRRLLFARIREAMSLGGTGAAPSLTQLDRGERSIDVWKKALRDLATVAEGYRSRALSTEDLGAVIDDHGAPVERRLAAAVTLGARAPDEARRRVRIAARACADEDLAAALEQAAEGEIAEALLAREAALPRAKEQLAEPPRAREATPRSAKGQMD